MSNPMTVGQVIDALMAMLDNGSISRDQILEIKTVNPSICSCSASGIAHIYPGFDWDHGRVLITPVKALKAISK